MVFCLGKSALNSLSSFLKNEDKEVLLGGATEQGENTLCCHWI